MKNDDERNGITGIVALVKTCRLAQVTEPKTKVQNVTWLGP